MHSKYQLRTPTKSERIFLLIVSPATFFLFYDLVFYWPWVAADLYDTNVTYILTYFTTINCIFFLYSFRHIIYRPINYFNQTQEKVQLWPTLACIIFSLCSATTVFLFLDGNLSFDLSEAYSKKSEKSASIVLLNSVFLYSILYCIYKNKLHFIAYVLAFAAIIFTLFIGGRSAAIVSLIILIFFLTRNYKIKFRFIFIFFCTLISIFVLTSIARGTISLDGESIALEALDYNQAFTLDETLRYSDLKGPKFHLYLADIADAFVPRILNPEKNTSTAFTREVFPWVWEKTSYTAGFYANIIFVFGIFGLFLAPILIFTINLIFLKALNSKKTNINSFIIFCFTICPVLLVRGGIFEQRILMVMLIIFLGAQVAKTMTRKISLSRNQKPMGQ